MNPQISIIIPHKDRFDLLLQTLKSVSIQTYKEWEVIIVDDYSHQVCIENIKTHIFNENRFILVTKTNEGKGAPISRNIGLCNARARYVLFLDSDDVLAPFALEQRINAFTVSKNPIQAVIAPTILFKKTPGDMLDVWNTLEKNNDAITRFTKCDNHWHTMGALWDKAFLTSISGWDETLASYQDWELHIRALLKGLSYYELKVYDNFYRIDSDDQSIASRFYKEPVIKGRFRAFLKVTKQIKDCNNKAWIKNLRNLIIRNMTLLIDNKKVDIVSDLLEDYSAFKLNSMDFVILSMMKGDPDSWRNRRLTKIFIQVFWKNVDYDPWKYSGNQKNKIDTNEKALQFNYEQLLLN